jgi:hypothetical protein
MRPAFSGRELFARTRLPRRFPLSLHSIGEGKGTKEGFATLKPGESLDFKASLDFGLIPGDPKETRLKLTYLDNGKSLGVKAWIGIVEVRLEGEAVD